MNDEELTRLAAEELIREAKKFMERRDNEFKATQMKQPMKANKRFLNNTIQNVVSFNNSQGKVRKIHKSKHGKTGSKLKKREKSKESRRKEVK